MSIGQDVLRPRIPHDLACRAARCDDVGVGLLRTISVVAVCCLLGLPAAEARKPKPKKGGRMVILSATSGAEIFVDGERIGTVPSETPIPLSAGTHHIKVELRGYTAYEDDVRIRSGRE